VTELFASIAFDAHPELEPVARSGTAGEVLEAVEPHTEADPAAVLANLLVWFGNAVGAGPHMRAGDARHPGRLFAVVVGETSVSRKGTARAGIETLLVPRTHHLTRPLVNQVRGLGSGEGLIQAVADQVPQPDVGRSVLVVADEFAQMITVMGRRGSTLSPIVRVAWDSERLAVTTRTNRLSISGAHVSIIAETTAEELGAVMPTLQMMNGFGNRFLWLLARRARHLPDGGGVPHDTAEEIAAMLRRRVTDARRLVGPSPVVNRARCGGPRPVRADGRMCTGR
jgi:hypothetical protein